jgi:hypothetical protein
MSRISRAAVTALVGVAAVSVVACSNGGVGAATGTPSPSSSGPSASAPASAEPSAGASASAALNQATLTFQEVAASEITGGAILTDLGGDQTAVTIGVVAAGIKDPMPAFIAPGTCETATASGSPGASDSAEPSMAASAEPSAAASPAASAGSASPEASGNGGVPLNPTSNTNLSDLTAGASNTVVNASLDTLLATPYSIVIHKSAKAPTVVACADIAR